MQAAYTFDAGPNAVIYTLKHNVEPLLQLFVGYFFPGDEVKSAPYVHAFSSCCLRVSAHSSNCVARMHTRRLHDPCKLSSAGRGEFKCGPISGAGASEEAKARDAALLKAVGTRRDGERVYQVIVTQVRALVSVSSSRAHSSRGWCAACDMWQVGDGPRISDERSGSSKSS